MPCRLSVGKGLIEKWAKCIEVKGDYIEKK